MLNKVKMTLMTLATMCLIVFSVLPHHHHDDGSICFVLEKCAMDGCLNDEHTGHKSMPDKDAGCKMNGDKGSSALISVHVATQNVSLLPFLPFIGLLSVAMVFTALMLFVKTGYGEFLVPHLFKRSRICLGLRAPPCYFL